MYSYTLSLTSVLDWVGGQRHAPAPLTPGMTRYPFYRRLGRSQGRSGWVLKISPPPGFDPRTVQLVASRYTDWAKQLRSGSWQAQYRHCAMLSITKIATNTSYVACLNNYYGCNRNVHFGIVNSVPKFFPQLWLCVFRLPCQLWSPHS
jgi:hypothetical protein